MDKYIYKIGRRKTATATVRLFEGQGKTMVNDKPIEVVYPLEIDKAYILEPLVLVNNVGKFYFTAKVKGSGVKSQRGAIRLGLARALATIDPEFKKILKAALMLRRDDRKVERKKTGLRKARKQEQYSKR